MVEKCATSHGSEVLEENFTITEINARFSFNGFMHEAYGQHGLDTVLGDTWARETRLTSATEPGKVYYYTIMGDKR